MVSEEKSREIDVYLRSVMREQEIPGIALAILKDGQVLKEAYYGLASLEFQVPVTEASAFWMASVSKHMTCTAIMQLHEQGILEIDREIHTYLADAPASWKGITLRHLMTHTSGLPESGKGSERGARSARGTYSAAQMYGNAGKDTLAFPPGEGFLYSDEGIFLLGYLIHKVSGLSFREYMQKKIFDPAGMHSAYLMDQFKIHPNQVSGYAKRNGEVIPDRNSWRLIDTEINAAGGVYATLRDMVHWERSMTEQTLLSENSKNLMWESYTLKDGRRTHYGFGWNTQRVNGKRILYHPGVSGTEYLRFPDDGLSIIVLTNQADYVRSIAQNISGILGISPGISEKDIKTGTPVTYEPDLSEVKSLVGQYEFQPNQHFYLDEQFLVEIILKQNEPWIEFPANKEIRNRFRLAKLENGRWMQLSWDPAFLEVSLETTTGKDANRSLKVYEHDGLEEYCVGELVKVAPRD